RGGGREAVLRLALREVAVDRAGEPVRGAVVRHGGRRDVGALRFVHARVFGAAAQGSQQERARRHGGGGDQTHGRTPPDRSQSSCRGAGRQKNGARWRSCSCKNSVSCKEPGNDGGEPTWARPGRCRDAVYRSLASRKSELAINTV